MPPTESMGNVELKSKKEVHKSEIYDNSNGLFFRRLYVHLNV